jgi:hypothetical protein
MMRKAEDQAAFYRLLAKLLWYLGSGKVMSDIYAIVLAIHLLLNRYSFLFLLLTIATSDP